MLYSISATALLTLLVTGCYDFNGSSGPVLQESDVEFFTFEFEPDMATGNVTLWWYEFEAPYDVVGACNINGNSYTATSWSLDADARTINVYFGADAEYYTITEASDDLSSGRFHYENSLGTTPMDGDWQRLSAKQCE